MTNNTHQKTPPLITGRSGGVFPSSDDSGLSFHLVRYMQNRTYTHGKLSIDGCDMVFDTLELAIPRDRFSYIKHCLPPGEYDMNAQLALLSFGAGAVRKPWAALAKIKWFPKAGIYTNFDDHSLLSGRIYVGLGSDDEWSVKQNDIVTAKIISAIQKIYDERTDTFTEPVKLIITESPDMIVHDYDRSQYEREQQLAKEQQEKEEAELRLQQLMDDNPNIKKADPLLSPVKGEDLNNSLANHLTH